MTTPNAPAPSEPFNSFLLDVDDGHQVYVEENGNPDGLPLISFHGGPGSFTKPKHRTYYDLNKFRLILFDQRCGGQSRPLAVENRAALAGFSPAAIVADAERIRQHLNIENWHVTGASWGSTMALLYAITYPEVTRSITPRMMFLGTARNWAWMANGAEIMAPPAFAAAQALAHGKRGIDLVQTLADRILSDDDALATAQALFGMEHGLEVLSPPPEPTAEPKPAKTDAEILNNALLYAHVIKNHLLPDGWATSDKAKAALRGKPLAIVHGACDVGCPLQDVYALQAAHPQAELHIAPNCGHGVDLGGQSDALYHAALSRLD